MRHFFTCAAAPFAEMFSQDSQNIDTVRFSFGKAVIINDHIAEVLIKEGVEVDCDMLEDLRQLWRSRLCAPFFLLINKVNHYTYSFEAQEKLFDLDGLDAIAVVAYSRITRLTTESLLKSFQHNDNRKVKIFSSRDRALRWLLIQRSVDPIQDDKPAERS